MSSGKKPYNKPPLSFEDQAKRLIKRGLIADEQELTGFLSRTNYYRFSTYLFPFRQSGSDDYLPKTEFSHIYMLYTFDQALRVLLFDALTALEISLLRTRFVQFFAQKYDAFGYTTRANFDMGANQHKSLLEQIQESVARSQEEFVKHFSAKYSNDHLPLWMAAEIVSFGCIMTMALNMHRADKKAFAWRYGVSHSVMDSWLRTLNYIRNCCAHHARLWNRVLAMKPRIPDEKHRPEFHSPLVDNSRIFAVLTIIQYLLNIVDPSHTWDADVIVLLDRFPDVPMAQMGFPEKWRELPMWKR